jgi:hypothetical protein
MLRRDFLVLKDTKMIYRLQFYNYKKAEKPQF